MRKLVLLVCMLTLTATSSLSDVKAGVIPTWESESGRLGFFPISNEISVYQNYDDAGEDRGRTLQVISINGFRLFTDFSFEFTADFNWQYSYADPFDLSLGMNSRDHYIELSVVKPVTSMLSLNVQRVIATFENESINQVGFRLSF
ncbi:MAG: hypothetical protein OEV49_01990 [candidate division Zixibacteria bacterium]|nr:hypothetical protein [candidate division Zixibacteria bacterium]MDH3937209.1 hypothetical protein [candidate division Zixibacteria bacterium]MDH4032666.1 hypothetical protein [candidate division Zixibacteria bacterium]